MPLSASNASPSPFEVGDEMVGGVRVLSVSGELDLGTAPRLEQPLEAALAADGSGVLIDLSRCEFIDSTGIALLVRAWQRLDSGPAGNGGDQGRFALCGLNDQVRRLLELSGLADSLSIHPSRDEALRALQV
jgi:anti-sigma B factor antagonist